MIDPDNLALLDAFGPHRAYERDRPSERDGAEERLVKTHCCFCGQQCGIQLKIRGDAVVGFEPWYEFPFNKGKLCPKGIKRYLQNHHPDRLVHAYARDRSSPRGFSELGYDDAIAQIEGAVRALRAAGKTKIVVVGFSIGANAAVGYAAR